MKRRTRITTRKNKAGEVSVIAHNSGFRALNVTGRITVPREVKSLSTLSQIIFALGTLFLGLFPFLKQERNTYITTYSFPETTKGPKLTLVYDFTFSMSAVDIPAEEAALTVLDRIGWLAGHLVNAINEEITSYSSPDP